MTYLALFVLYALALSAALAWKGLPAAGAAPDRAPTGTAGATATTATTAATAATAATADTTVPAPRGHRLLVVGATGGTGRQVVAQALERGYEVTAFVRDPARLPIEHPRLRVAVGDVLDPRAVAAAVEGQDAVVSALGHKRWLGPSRILSEGTRNLLAAMAAHGARRLVCQTSLGIGGSAGRMGLYYTLFVIPVILPFYFWDKCRQERAIAASDPEKVEWVVVRPGALTDRPAPRPEDSVTGRLRHGSGVGSFLLTVRVSRAEAAGFLLDQVEDDRYLGAAVGIAS